MYMNVISDLLVHLHPCIVLVYDIAAPVTAEDEAAATKNLTDTVNYVAAQKEEAVAVAAAVRTVLAMFSHACQAYAALPRGD